MSPAAPGGRDQAAAAKAFGITFEVPAETVDKYKRDYKIDLEAASGSTHHLLSHPSVFIVDTSRPFASRM